MHLPVPVQGAWLRSVVLGHYRYYGVPHNAKALQRFRKEVARLWQRSLSRRSHKGYVTWDRMERYVDKWLPVARIYHPHPDERFGVMTRGRSPVPLKKSRTRVELNSTLVILSLAVPQEPSTQSARTGLAREGENPWDTSSRKLRFERLYRAE
jgi:hypothetical protein